MNSLKRHLVIVVLMFVALAAWGYRPACARDTLEPGDMLKRGQSLVSDNQRYRLVLERDGNLVLYDEGLRPLWSAGTRGKAVQRCVMQRDGNLVLYLHNDKPAWSSNTARKPGSFLVLQNDGNLVIYQPRAVWSTGTHRGERDERRGRWEEPFERRDHERWDDRER